MALGLALACRGTPLTTLASRSGLVGPVLQVKGSRGSSLCQATCGRLGSQAALVMPMASLRRWGCAVAEGASGLAHLVHPGGAWRLLGRVSRPLHPAAVCQEAGGRPSGSRCHPAAGAGGAGKGSSACLRLTGRATSSATMLLCLPDRPSGGHAPAASPTPDEATLPHFHGVAMTWSHRVAGANLIHGGVRIRTYFPASLTFAAIGAAAQGICGEHRARLSGKRCTISATVIFLHQRHVDSRRRRRADGGRRNSAPAQRPATAWRRARCRDRR